MLKLTTRRSSKLPKRLLNSSMVFKLVLKQPTSPKLLKISKLKPVSTCGKVKHKSWSQLLKILIITLSTSLQSQSVTPTSLPNVLSKAIITKPVQYNKTKQSYGLNAPQNPIALPNGQTSLLIRKWSSNKNSEEVHNKSKWVLLNWHNKFNKNSKMPLKLRRPTLSGFKTDM